MPRDSKQAVARLTETVPAPPRAALALEAAFLAFLEAKTAPTALVPIERRIFLTVAEAAEYTGLPAAFLRRLMTDGTLQGVRTGGGWRIPRAELESLPGKLAHTPDTREQLSEAEERDLEMNKLRRQGLLPPEVKPEKLN